MYDYLCRPDNPKIALLRPSGLPVNVGIVLPFAVDPGIQPNEFAGKLAPSQLLSITDIALTVENNPAQLLSIFSTVVFDSSTGNNDRHTNNTFL